MKYCFPRREVRDVCRGTICLENSEKLDFLLEQEQRRKENQMQILKELQEKKLFLEECMSIFQENGELIRATKRLIEKWNLEEKGVRNIPQMTMQLTNVVAAETQIEWVEWKDFLKKVYEKVGILFKDYLFEDVFIKRRQEQRKED